MRHNAITKCIFKIMWMALQVGIALIIIDKTMLWLGARNAQYEKTHPKSAIIKSVKVFQIGFSKCGTVTLANFFSSNGVPTIHHDNAGLLPLSIYQNHQQGLPLLAQKYSKFLVFTDMDLLQHDPQISIGLQLFKELDKQYPGSKFILNTRNKEAWLESRSRQRVAPSKQTLLEITANMHACSESQVLQKWSNEWDQHLYAVTEYFKDRPHDLLVFDLDHDKPVKIVEFFKEYFVLDPSLYAKKNTTPNQLSRLTQEWIHDFKWVFCKVLHVSSD